MLNKRLYPAGWTIASLVLILALTVSSAAQQSTPTTSPTPEITETTLPAPSPTETEALPPPTPTRPTASPTMTPALSTIAATPLVITATPQVTETLLLTTTVTPSPTLAMSASITPSETAPDIATLPDVNASKRVELTVYNQNLGLVKEVRALDLGQGDNIVRYSDVAAQIQPESVHIVSLTDPEGMAVLEQNYEYDLVNSAKLLEKYTDQQIALSTKEGRVYTGTLLSGEDDVILATTEGVKVVKLDYVQEFSFPQLPEGLITKPSLVWLLRAAQTGVQDVRVTYLTNGINWQANYIGMLAPDDKSLSLTGWVTLDNQSGAAFQNAKLKLVAGDINRAPQAASLTMAKDLVTGGDEPQVEERAFFEYHLYEVARPVTVLDRQTKQIEFIVAPQVAAEKVFVYEPSPDYYPYNVITDPSYGVAGDKKVQVRVEFKNDAPSGLGAPLPRGVVRVYKEDTDGGAELVGEDTIQHTPKDESVSLLLGEAFDIVGERTQTQFVKLSERSAEESYAIVLRNHKSEATAVRVIEHLFRASEAKMVSSSVPYELLDAHTLRYNVEVQPDSEARLEYTVRYTW